MKKLEFLIAGSEPTPYTVVFQNTGTSVTISCTCAAGKSGQLCKHRMNLINGDVSSLSSNNRNELNTALSWLTGTKIKSEIDNLNHLENTAEQIKKEISNKKKQIGRLFIGN